MKLRILSIGGITAVLTASMFGCARSEQAASGVEQTRERPGERRLMLVAGRQERSPNYALVEPRSRDDADESMLPRSCSDPMTSVEEQRMRVTAVASEEPPLALIEVPPHEPREGEFWVAGHWRPDSNGYGWEPGRIEQDRPGCLFVPANVVASERGWEYTPEYWR